MLFWRSKPAPPPPPAAPSDPLDRVIFTFSDVDPFTIRDACQGVHIFGETGSGKTSGSGRAFALSYLRAGFGGLVLTAKADEIDLWRKYTREAGRDGDLLVFGEGSPHRFDILGYECQHDQGGLGLTHNLIELFLTLQELAGKGGSRARSDTDSFWRKEIQKLIGHSIRLLHLSGEKINLRNIAQVIRDAPRKEEDYSSDSWREASFLFKCGAKANERRKDLSESEAGDLDECIHYWVQEFPIIPAKTRANLLETYSGIVATLSTGMMRELLTKDSTLTPDDTFHGKIIVLNLPPKRFHEAGLYTQVIFKYCWQRAVERRRVDSDTRPVFLWADEAHHFVNHHDVGFQTTARSSRACTVYLTQNLPNYLYSLGEGGAALADSLLGNLATKIFHSNTCATTNKYASALFAQDWQTAESFTFNYEKDTVKHSRSEKQALQDIVLPREFSGMMSGGPANDYMVEGIVNKAGRNFNLTSTNALKVLFRQPKPK